MQELLPLKQVVILSRHGREVLQGPRGALLHFKPLTLPQPRKWIRPQVQILSKVTAEAAAPSSYTFQGIRSSCCCRGSTLLQTSATTTYHSSISANFETKWEKKELLAASSIFFLNETLLSEEGRQDRAGTCPPEQQWWLEDSEWFFPTDECHKLTFHQDSVV